MDRENDLNFLSSRAGFNTALRHFKTVTAFASEVQEAGNLADLLNDSIERGEIQRFQVRPILNALIVDKFAYAYRSHNLLSTVEDVSRVVETVRKWNNLQYVLAYHHPQNGLVVINPANPESWEPVLPLLRDEFLVVHAGFAYEEGKRDILENAADDFLTVLYGGKVAARRGYTSAKAVQKEPERAPVHTAPAPTAEAPASGAKRRITPRYSVVVTNELFHNGNVEAWKKIIQSYRTKYPELDVLIWYENERINDINALFKWGKVKHGVPILFSVSGADIRDVSKLQRYLYEGASPRFEVFLKGEFDRTLDLF
jgi:hypothetical protein